MTRNVSSSSISRIMALAGAILVGLVAILRPSALHAEGAPTTAAIIYAVTLLNGGVPVSDPTEIGVTLWSTLRGGGTTEMKCEIKPTSLQVDASGRFRIPLDSCRTAIRSNPDLWLELQVKGTVLYPRIKLGAVPYAQEAGNAARATFQLGARKLTLQGQFCGATAPVDGRLDPEAGGGGFPAAKSLCEVACSGSPTAHVCHAEELVRLQQLGAGMPMTTGWIATGIATMGSDGTQCVANDCEGFTSNQVPSGGTLGTCGTVWTGRVVTTHSCGQPAPILCCD
jgi:hypothetical protein